MKIKFTILQSLMVCMFLGVVSIGYAQKSITKVSKDLSDFEKKHEKRVKAPLLKSNDTGLTAIDNVQMFNGLVVIEAVAKGDPSALLAQLETLGLQKGSSYGGMISGLFPVDKISDLEGVKALKFVRPAYKPMNRVGSVTSQGDVGQFSDVARSSFGVDGTGYRVGILSDSWNTREGDGQASGIASGDLPEDIMVLEEFPFPGSDEGRAMGELIFDVAPGVSLAFNTAFLGQAGFANGILALADAGSDVIVDDIIYFAEPMFQDGIIGQAADIVSKNGVPYFSAAGNNLDDSYESAFNNGGKHILKDFRGFELGEYVLHDFDPGPGVDFFQEVNLPGGGRNIILSFQWDEPFASVCADCPGSASDMDILVALVDGDLNTIFTDLSGVDGNIGGDAVEVFGVQSDAPVTGYLVIGKWTGKVGDVQFDVGPNPNPGLIKYVNLGSAPIIDYATNSGTSYGHANAKRAVSVGAVRYDQTPAFGVQTPIREVFSSSGGVPTLFDINGNRYDTREVRKKPEISAVQGTNNTFFGSFDYERDGFPNFFGTSASAPHAAGVAALMLEATDGNIRPNQITKAMQKTAIDMDDPRTAKFDKGFDFATGAGFLKADDAVARAIQIGSNNRFAIADAKPTSNLKVLPNPSNGKVTFSWDSKENEKTKLLVYNNMGLLMQEFVNDKSRSQQNDFSRYPSGVYTVKLLTANTSEVRRFIIK